MFLQYHIRILHLNIVYVEILYLINRCIYYCGNLSSFIIHTCNLTQRQYLFEIRYCKKPLTYLLNIFLPPDLLAVSNAP